MATFIASALTAGFTQSVTTTLVNFAVSTAVTVGVSAAAGALAGKPKSVALQDPGAQLRFGPNPNAARQFVYGETAVSGQLIYQGTTGDDNKFLHMIIVLGDGGEYSGVQSVDFDDETLTLDGSDMITSPSKWAQKARVQYNTGHPSTQTAFSDAVSEITEWTSNHKGLGTALAYIRLEYDPEAFQSVPTPKFVVRGRKVYDPRLDTSPGANPDNATYWAWTQNPVLWALDYLRGIKSGGVSGDRMGGLGIGNDLIDWQSWNDAADVCDENVTVNAGGTIDRYTGGGGVVSSDDEPLSVLEAMAATFAGTITTRSGKVACYAGEAQTATVTLTDDDLAGPVQVSTAVSVRETANAVSAQYREPSIGYEQQTAPPYRNSTWETEDDSEVLWTQLDLAFVDDHRRAQWLSKIHGGNLREPRQLTAKYKIKAIQILEGEVFTLSSDSYGAGVNGKYRLLQKTINVDGTVDIVAKSETDSKYDWTAATDEQTAPTGTLVTSDTPTPATPSGWTVTPTDITGPQGATVTVLDVTSPGSLPTSTETVEFQIQRQAGPTLGLDMSGGQFASAATGAAADASYQTVASLSVAQADQGLRIPNIERSRNYNTRVRYRNKFGAAGSWQTISSAVGVAGAATSAPTGWTASSGTITSAEGHTRPVLAVTAPTAGVAEEAGQVSIDARKTTETEFTQQQVMTRSDASRGVNITAEPGTDYIVRVRYGADASTWGPAQHIPVSSTATSAITITSLAAVAEASTGGAFTVPGLKVTWDALTGDDLQRARNIEIQHRVNSTTQVTTIYAEPDETGKSIHNLLAGVQYNVRARVSDIFSAGTWSSWVNGTPGSTWTTGLATSVEWDDVADGGGNRPSNNATVGATWGTDVNSRPTELTDGRVSAGLDASGDINRNITSTRLDSSNALRRTGGGLFTGALAATAGATWGTDVASRPTELTDGRVSAGLDASGDLNRNISSTRLDSSNALRRTGGGLFTGALAATAGATWGTDVGSRPTELTDGRISAGLDASGDLNRNISSTRLDSSNALRRTGGGLYTGALAATAGATWGTDVASRPAELTDGRITTGLNASGVLQTNIPNASQIPNLSASILTSGTLPIARIADNAVTLAKLAGGTADEVLALDGSGNPTTLKILDANVGSNRSLVTDGSGAPDATLVEGGYMDTSPPIPVFWVSDTGTSQAIRATRELQKGYGTSAVTVTNVTNGVVVAKVTFENVRDVQKIYVVDTNEPSWPAGDDASTTGTEGQWKLYVKDDAVGTYAIGDTLVSGTLVWSGATNGLTFSGSPIEAASFSDIDDMEKNASGTGGVDGIYILDLVTGGFDGKDLTFYLTMDVTSGGPNINVGNTGSSIPLFEMLLD